MPNEPYVEEIMVADGDGDHPDVEEVKYENIVTGDEVTGVKGNAESTYRTGNVNITMENIVDSIEDGGSPNDNQLFLKNNSLLTGAVWRPFSYIWDYIKTKLGIGAAPGTDKYLNQQGNWAVPPDTNTWPDDNTYKSKMLDMCYPVGSIYTSTKNVSPATFLGGTWKRLNGYMLRGATSGVTFNNNAKDGGADSVTVTSVASHNHTQNSHNHTQDTHSHVITSETSLYVGGMNQNTSHGHRLREEYGAPPNVSYPPNNTYSMIAGDNAESKAWYSQPIESTNTDHLHQVAAHDHYQVTGAKTATNQATTATNNATGGNYSVSTLPNYKNVYMWERTA